MLAQSELRAAKLNAALPTLTICPKLVGWTYKPSNGEISAMRCKARLCSFCGVGWAWKWRQALKEKEDYDLSQGIPRISRALTLTTRQQVNFLVLRRAVEYFFRFVRKHTPELQYWGVVEYNQRHTLPHLHFVLSNDRYIHQSYLVECWIKAQTWAGIEIPAHHVRIEKIKGNTAQYFTKYISKLTDGKDEVPRRENWQGRYVRYSKKFFPTSVPTMAVYASLKRQFEAGEFDARPYFHVRQPLQALPDFFSKADATEETLNYLLNRDWQPHIDRQKAQPLEPPGQLSLPSDQPTLDKSKLPSDNLFQLASDFIARAIDNTVIIGL